jgi:hypothetical protein
MSIPQQPAGNSSLHTAAHILAALTLIVSLVAGVLLFTLDSLGSSSVESAIVAEDGTVLTSEIENRAERSPENERTMQFWGVVVFLLAIAAFYGVRSGRRWLAWVPAVLLTTLSILGAASIGFLVAPVALLSLAAAITLTAARGDGPTDSSLS